MGDNGWGRRDLKFNRAAAGWQKYSNFTIIIATPDYKPHIRLSAIVLGYNTECDKRHPFYHSVESGGSDPDLCGRCSANGPSAETRGAIVLYLFTTPPSSKSFSANGH